MTMSKDRFNTTVISGSVIGAMASGPGAVAVGSVSVDVDRYLSAALPCAKEDELLAGRIVRDLRAAGASVLYPPEHPGAKRHRLAWIAGNDKDRLILLCTKNTLDDGHVQHIIRMVLEREADAGGDAYIIPLSVDGCMKTWIPVDADKDLQTLSGRVSIEIDSRSVSWPRAISKIISALRIK